MIALLLFFLLLPGSLFAQSTYGGLSKTAPAPANFVPYGDNSPWKRPLPANPVHTIPSENAEARSYFTNTGQHGMFWRAAGTNHFSSCYRPDQANDGFNWNGQPWYHCGGNAGFSTFVASSTDPLVTFHCHSEKAVYGCWENGVQVSEITQQIRVPHNLVPTCNWTSYCGDINWAVVQPDGTTYEVYACEIHQEITGGELLGTAIAGDGRTPICQEDGVPANKINGALKESLATGEGVNSTINSGPNVWALQLYYNHVAISNPTPRMAIWLNVTCNGPGHRYPATSDTSVCSNSGRGLPTGTHVQLTLTHAQIDQEITNGTVPAAFRGILYAAHDYGIYFGDTGTDSIPRLKTAWLEDSVQQVANGAQSFWEPWFQSLVPYGAVMDAGTGESGANTYYIQYNPFYQLAQYFQVVNECYAYGTCSDSLPGGTPSIKTYYVATTGNDGNSCAQAESASTPKATPNGGIGCMNAGDTLIIQDGTYTASTLTVPPSGTVSNPTTIRAANQRGAILRLPSGHANGLTLSNRAYITLDGLVFDGQTPTNRGYAIALGANTTNITIKNGEIRNISTNNNGDNSGGISFGFIPATPTILIQNMWLHDIGADDVASNCDSCFSYGFAASTNGTVFDGNTLERISGYGLIMYDGGGGSMNNNIIKNNTFIDTGTILLAYTGTGNQFYNNLLVRVGTTVYPYERNSLSVAGTTNTLVNNTIVNGGAGPGVGDKNCIALAGTGNIVRNNICYQNGQDVIAGSGNTLSNNLLGGNPQFVNPGSGDYHLGPTSALAINQGTNTNCPGTDKEGLLRPQDSTCDIGAYEYGGPPPATQVTIYVSGGGHGDTPSDSNTCTQAQTITTPRATIPAGMACLQYPGSTLKIRGATYTAPPVRSSMVTPPMVGGLDWNTATRIEAYNGETVILRLDNSATAPLWFDRGTEDQYIILNGLTVDANNLGDHALGIDGGGHHIRFQNGVLRNANLSVVSTTNGDGIEVLTSLVENATTYPLFEAQGTSSGVKIEGNTLRTSTGSNAILIGSGASNVRIAKNQISNIGASAQAALDVAGDGADVINNMVWSCYAGLRLRSGSDNAEIYNNTIYGCTTFGMQLDATSSNVLVKNNIVVGNGTAQITNNTGASLTTNLTTNPGFLNPGAGDLRLTESSLTAIDQGTNLPGVVDDDLFGTSRSTMDIGAHEFQGTPVAPPPVAGTRPNWATSMFFAH